MPTPHWHAKEQRILASQPESTNDTEQLRIFSVVGRQKSASTRI